MPLAIAGAPVGAQRVGFRIGPEDRRHAPEPLSKPAAEAAAGAIKPTARSAARTDQSAATKAPEANRSAAPKVAEPGRDPHVAAEPAAAPKPKLRPKPSGPSLTIVNARDAVATQVAVVAGDKTIRTSKPLAPKGRTVMKLPRMKGCTVTVAAAYADDEALTEVGEVNVCKEKSVRLTD